MKHSYNTRSVSQPNFGNSRSALKRRLSITSEVSIPKAITRSDLHKLPVVPKFIEVIKSLDILEGETAQLNCKIVGNPLPTIYWYKDGKSISCPSNKIWTETTKEGYHTLVIRNATIDDRGTYLCVITNRLGRSSSVCLVNVHQKSTNNKNLNGSAMEMLRHSFEKGMLEKDLSHSSRNSLKMSSTPIEDQKLEFIRRSLDIADTSSTHRGSIESNTSLIASSTYAPSTDSEGYSSSKSQLNDSFESSASVTSSSSAIMSARIQRSPQFIVKPQSHVVEEGKSTHFLCKVTGNPQPTVDWYKVSTKLKTSDRVNIQSTAEGESNLELQDLTALDAGKYRCVAHNSAGKASCSVELVLTAGETSDSQMSRERAPSFSQVLKPSDVKSGSRVRFECKVEGRPKPTVQWNKDGKPVSASGRVRIMEVYGTHSLIISRTELTDAGNYSISASNHIGNDSCSAQLHVQEMSASRGSSVSQLSGNYTSSTHSSPNASNLSSPSRSPKLNRAAQSRLVSGSVASWSAGIKPSGGGRVGGGPPPRRRGPGFILRPRPQTITTGESLCLKCTLLGHPKPTVTWEKDGDLVDEEKTDGHIRTRNDNNDYYLEIDECGTKDAGKYGVTARNSLGKQTAAVDVMITGGGSGNNSQKVTVSKPTTNHQVAVTKNDNANTPGRHNGSHTVTSEEEKKPRVQELIIPTNLKPDDSKDSPTSSISSTVSSHSRVSTSSSRHDLEAEDTVETHKTSAKSNWSKRHFVAPTFTRRLSSTQVLEGEELLLQCEVSGDPDPELSWMRNGRSLGIDEDEVFTSFRNGIARLRLRDLQSQHAGEYVCKARNDGGIVQCSSRVTVKAKPVHTPPRFTKRPSDQRLTEGDKMSLEAEVTGSPIPEIVWSLDGEEVSIGESSYHGNVAKLEIGKITMAYSGQYMCCALNSSGEDSVACRVRVKQLKNDIPPEFTAPLSDVTTTDGDDVCLRCMVTGIPEPRVEWMFNDEIMEAEEGVEITYHDGVAALTLEQATEDDNGLYTCSAFNDAGAGKTSCQVTIKPLPKPEKKIPSSVPKFSNLFDEYTRTQEGDVVTLECDVTGNPKPTVTWSINDTEIENAHISYENGKASITIDPMTSSHGGHIKCEILNSAGKATHQSRIYVRSKRVAPTFLTNLPEVVNVGENEEANFECKVTGHPQPRVTWTRDGRSLSVLSTDTSYEDGIASVRIRKAGHRDGGKYVCSARNLSGEAESICTVNVTSKPKPVIKKEEPALAAPQFTETLKDVTLDDWQDLRLQCRVTGNPTPEVSWSLDGQKMDGEDGDLSFENGVAKLVLEDVMQEDSGQYGCVAINSVGKAETFCCVTVNAPAKKNELKEPPKEVSKDKEPHFPIQLEDLTVKEGKDIVLNCQVLGNPRPKITWLLDGEELLDADIKYAEDGNITLLLTEALPEDEGVYTCIAENPLKRVMCSCKVTIDVPAKQVKKKQTHHIPPAVKKIENSTPPAEKREAQAKAVELDSAPRQQKQEESVKPYFTERMQDQIVPDGSTNFKLYCQVAGTPEPTAQWYFDDQLMEENADFEFVSRGDERILKFTEVFPEDSGMYTCVISNSAGDSRTQCNVRVEEIDGDAPTFLLKPKPCNVDMGEKATFSCRVDGEPVPTVRWLFCNKPIQDSRMVVVEGNADNNYTHSLEIIQTSPQDAGRYSVTCSNLLGDITCTVSLIVGGGKKQDKSDFRDVLRKSAKPNLKSQSSTDEKVDFRSVLRTPSTDKDVRNLSSSGSEDPCDDPTVAYKEALSSTVKTKHLTEEARKMKRAEQKDFRSETLTRKVETKVTTQDALRHKGSEQLDFRDEALKIKVKTKVMGQDDYKVMSPEQKDFRDVAIKSKVVTKAYREETVKAKRPEQVDFRNVLSPTKKEVEEKANNQAEAGTLSISELPKAKWKKDNVDNTTVATRRARHRGAVPERRMEQNGEQKQEEVEEEEEEETFSAPIFTQPLKALSIKDGEPFELVCHVTGDPEPDVTWFLEEEEVKAEADITIVKEGTECRLSIAESFPEDQGKYICCAKNEHGEVTCHSYVTVLTDEADQSKPPASYMTKKTLSPTSSLIAASIKNGPRDSTVIRGNPISICCELAGTQPLKVVWRKGRDLISHSHQCNIETTKSFSALTIKKSERDDSGCYTLQVTNQCGVDQFSVSVNVVDVPDPPGKPFAEIKPGGVVVSWYGSGYDGGSSIKSYLLECTKLKNNSGGGRKIWKDVATTNSTSYTVKNLEENASYLFRVSAENEYGMGRPGSFSNILQNIPAVENGADTTDDESEGEFVQYEPVEIRQNEKFSTRYEIKDKLGQGRFGKVHRVVDRKSGKQYAAKIMRALKAKDREAVSLEIEIMNALRHPKLVQLIDAYNHGREIHMVMDLVAGGELFERVIDEDFELTEAACIKYMKQICSGVQFMHDQMIVHLDLKPENIMCINKTGTKIKIIDFGLARKFNPTEPIKVMFGTPEFVAPEVINYDVIGFQTDMWSVGVICYILLSGLSPFSGDADSETLSNITAVLWDFDDEAFDQISDEAKDFISKLLVKSMKNRFTVDKALKHKWLNNATNKMSKKLDTKNLKRFLARRKWQKTGNAVRALSRLTSLARLTTPSTSGQPRESGFLSSLRAELVREKENNQTPPKHKPEFVQKFDDIEVIEGSAAKFQCTVSGVPDPEIIWYKDGKPIKESRHFRISYTEDDVCTLLVTEASEDDDAEYMCRAINSEGEVELHAELIVICSGA